MDKTVITPDFEDPFALKRSSRIDPRGLFRGASAGSVPSSVELGKRFRSLRKQAGISRAEAARRVGCSPRSIERFEKDGKGSAALMLDLVRAMSSATGFSDAFLTPKFRNIREVVHHGRRRA